MKLSVKQPGKTTKMTSHQSRMDLLIFPGTVLVGILGLALIILFKSHARMVQSVLVLIISAMLSVYTGYQWKVMPGRKDVYLKVVFALLSSGQVFLIVVFMQWRMPNNLLGHTERGLIALSDVLLPALFAIRLTRIVRTNRHTD